MTGLRTAEIAVRSDVTPPGGGLSALAQAAVDAGMPEGTRRKYQQQWQWFLAWCERTGRCPMPASGDTVTEYITHLAYEYVVPGTRRVGKAPSSLQQARWAIVKAHEVMGQPAPPVKQALQVIRGYQDKLSKAEDPRARPRKADPLTRDTAASFAAAAADDKNELLGLRNRAMLLLALATAARVSELVALNIGSISFTEQGMVVHIYRIKTQGHQDVKIRYDVAPATIAAVRAWLAKLAEHGRTEGPLFPRVKGSVIGYTIRRHGRPIGDPDGRMSTDAAEDVMDKLAAAAGIQGTWTIHSGRSGFATEARRAGHDRLMIASGGGWHPDSPAVLGYIHEVDGWVSSALEGVAL